MNSRQKMMMNKRGFGSLNNPQGLLKSIIVAVIAVLFIAGVIGTLINATILLSTVSNMPFATMFATGGVVILLIGAGVIFLFLKVFNVSK